MITAGAPLAVRAAPGWDAEVSYEIADGSFVTVWDGAQAAPDGSLWYPVDGGFVPVDAVSSPPTLDGAVALYQDAGTEDKVAPATADPPAADAAAADQAMAPAPTEEWVEPAATEAATDAASKEALTDPSGAADPATSEWTDPVPVDPAAPTGGVDPATGEWVDPATVEEVPATPVDAAPVASEPAGAPAPLETVGSGGTEPWGEPIATAYIAGTGGDGAALPRCPGLGSRAAGRARRR